MSESLLDELELACEEGDLEAAINLMVELEDTPLYEQAGDLVHEYFPDNY